MSPLLALLVGLAVASGVSGQVADCAGPGFVAADSYIAPGRLRQVLTADMTGEGLPDLVGTVEDSSEPSIVVFPGLPDGALGNPIETPVVDTVFQIVAGDFTGDDVTDIVGVSFSSSALLFVGNGDGSLQPPEALSVGVSSTLLAVDADADGLLDLATSASGLLRVYLNQGSGVFEGPVLTPIWKDSPLAFGNLDGDSFPDLVGPRPPSAGSPGLVYYPGRGDGTFDPSLPIFPEGEATSLALADFTGDGVTDVAAGEGFAIRTAIGHGDGTFEPPVTTFDPVARAIFAADLNGDGAADLLNVRTNEFGEWGGALTTLISSRDGGFVADRIYATGFDTFGLATADFGGDGRVDVAVVGADQPAARVMRGNGDGTLRAPTIVSFGAAIAAMASGDFNEDGYLDLAEIFSFFSSQVTIHFGGPRARFAGGNAFVLGGSLTGLAAADVNGDGHLDLATLSRDGSTLAIVLGHGDGTFTIVSNTPVPSVSFDSGVIFAHLDADGIVDALTIDRSQESVSEQIGVFLGNGDGTFGTRPALSLGLPATAVEAADLDDDGILEILATGSFPFNPGDLFVFPGQGGGTYGPATSWTTGSFPTAVRAADLDENGLIDVVVGSGGDSPLLVFPGNGDGTLEAPNGVAAGGSVSDLVAEDFNGDGHVDLVTAAPRRLRILYGLGDGAFHAPLAYGAGLGGRFAPGDFDADGSLDVALGGTSGLQGNITLFLNAGLTAELPESFEANPGLAVVMTAGGSGLGEVAYQWRKDGVPLSDAGAITGSQTPVLTIDPVSFDDAGSYDVVVSDDCGEVTSNAASLTVEFADVPPSSPFHDDILTIATDGIAAGCGGGNYCPISPVRRDQMAVFLLKSEHGSDYTPPPCAGVFDDVPCPGSFADWIEQLAAEGVTGGCGGDNYCPANSVTRAQMAIFLLKTSEGSGYTPPAATGIFGDVPVGSFGADFIEELYDRGITGGCSVSPLLYCPDGAVLRQQMATFLVRTFLP